LIWFRIREVAQEMKVEKNLVPLESRKKKPENEGELGFGDIFTDHMFMMDHKEGKGWCDPRIVRYQDINLDPAAITIHYGQSLFEGLKCYHRKDGGAQLFRVRDNFNRFNRGATRICMPEVDVDFAVESLKELIRVDMDWIPHMHGTSLYIRPTMIGTEPHLGVRPATEYLFYIIIGPVGTYYKEGFSPIRILVTDEYVRAVRGGVGDVKVSGNYAASLLAFGQAKKKGFAQNLWLDAVEMKNIEEVGTSNIFFLFEDELVTPPLTGSILPGITRQTVLDLTREWGDHKVVERLITIDEVVEGARDGSLKEVFGSGTAVIVSAVGEINYKNETTVINEGKVGPLAQKLFDEIIGIQYGDIPDTHGWIDKV
jgi:branched-chain amino acid aminotransferase